MYLKRLSILLLLLVFSGLISASETFVEGDDYEVLATPIRFPDNGQVVVMEFFWYGCTHCQSLEMEIHSWLKQRSKDVVFLGVAAPINPRWQVHARAFYIAQSYSLHRQLHAPLFDAIAGNPAAYADDEALADFFAGYGVFADDYLRLANSSKIDQSVDRALKLAKAAGVEYVPQFVVAGRYRTSPSLAGGNKESIDVLRFLIDKVRKELAAK